MRLVSPHNVSFLVAVHVLFTVGMLLFSIDVMLAGHYNSALFNAALAIIYALLTVGIAARAPWSRPAAIILAAANLLFTIPTWPLDLQATIRIVFSIVILLAMMTRGAQEAFSA